MSHIEIQPDNLTKRQKKLTYLLIIILLIITVVFGGIIKRTSNYELAIRNGKNFTSIECEIIGYRAKFNSSVFKYKYQGKEYKFSQHFTDELQIGEMYRGRLNIHQPEVAIMLLNEPVIDTTEYKTAIARIIEIGPQKDELNHVTYSYEIVDKKYIRTEFVSRAFKWGIGDKVSVLYKKDNPKISYIERKTGGNKL
jgi:hypothetical protein